MNELLETINAINEILKAEDNKELKALLKDFPELEDLVVLIEDYEAELMAQLNTSKDEVISAIRSYIATGEDVLLQAVLPMIEGDVIAADTLAGRTAIVSNLFLVRSFETLVPIMMKKIDADTAFSRLSPRSLKWVEDWSEDLGKLMKNTNASAVSEALAAGLKHGEGIEEIITRLEGLPAFDRKRARATAVTEILTANSYSQQEAYSQSPAVTGKMWRHSGAKGIKPRPHHVLLSGTTIEVEEYFQVGGSMGLFPRDTNLPAKERVYCHCVLSPVIDKSILLLPKGEKELLHEERMESLENMGF